MVLRSLLKGDQLAAVLRSLRMVGVVAFLQAAVAASHDAVEGAPEDLAGELRSLPKAVVAFLQVAAVRMSHLRAALAASVVAVQTFHIAGAAVGRHLEVEVAPFLPVEQEEAYFHLEVEAAHSCCSAAPFLLVAELEEAYYHLELELVPYHHQPACYLVELAPSHQLGLLGSLQTP